jgi:DNA polymerase-3 subunit delta
MQLSPTEFLKAIRKGQRYNLLMLCGEDEYLLRETLNEYLALSLDASSRDFDYSEFRGSETEGKSLLSALTTFPLMSSMRTVLLDSPNQMEDDAQAALAKYLKQPSKSTALVLVQMMSAREKIPAEFAAAMTIVIFAKKKEHERITWAAEYAKSRGKLLHPDAAEYLIRISGGSLSEIATKLDHAILFIGEDSEINIQILMRISGITSEYNVFQLEDAIINKNQREVLRVARSLIEGGEPLLRTLAFQRGVLMRLWKVMSALKKDNSGTIIKELFPAGQDWKVSKVKEAARKFSDTALRSALVEMLEVEIHAKSSGSESVTRYYEWLWRLAAAA